MGVLDSLVKSFSQAAGQKLDKAAADVVKKSEDLMNNAATKEEVFTFGGIVSNCDELKALPEATLDSPFKTAALAVMALCNFEHDEDGVFEMLDYLNGPDEVSVYTKQFIAERLKGKYYKSFSFFEGATPENRYKPSLPYKVRVISNPYSFADENWATLYVKSSGADELRSIKLRKKPSTGQWFINDIQCLSDIRVPVSEDPWA